MIEGISAEVQRFKLQIPIDETIEILLKWSNINEEDKLFKDKKEDYSTKDSSVLLGKTKLPRGYQTDVKEAVDRGHDITL